MEAVGIGVPRADPKTRLSAEKTRFSRLTEAHAKRAIAVRKDKVHAVRIGGILCRQNKTRAVCTYFTYRPLPTKF